MNLRLRFYQAGQWRGGIPPQLNAVLDLFIGCLRDGVLILPREDV